MNYQNNRFGSAAWASDEAIFRAGLFRPAGPFLGYRRGRMLRLAGDGPIITFGGAGSGKLTTLLAYNLCGFRDRGGRWHMPPRMVVNDPRGELTAISIGNQARFKRPVYCINPYGLHGLPQHRVNPWDFIRKDSPTFHADVKMAFADLIPLAPGEGKYFSARAREWSEAIGKTLAWSQP